MFLHLVQRSFEFSRVQQLQPRFMISKTDCALQTVSLPSRSCLLEAPLFVVDKRYMRSLLPDSSPSSTEVIRETQPTCVKHSKFVRFIIQSDDKVQPYIKGADRAVHATSDTRTNSDAKNTPDHICIPGHKRQAPMMGSLGENVGMGTRQFVKHRNAHLQAIVAKLGRG
jgi:hypothetical protein